MISSILKKMIAASEGSLHDIDHFLRVWAYAKTIGELEQIGEEKQFILEAAALVHDIACPSLRARYGCCDGKRQEAEGVPMARELLEEFALPESQLERILYLVGHHHTLTGVDGIDLQILLEADAIANLGETGADPEKIRNTREHLFQTSSGTALLNSIYRI